jgi:hypothetical protein
MLTRGSSSPLSAWTVHQDENLQTSVRYIYITLFIACWLNQKHVLRSTHYLYSSLVNIYLNSLRQTRPSIESLPVVYIILGSISWNRHSSVGCNVAALLEKKANSFPPVLILLPADSTLREDGRIIFIASLVVVGPTSMHSHHSSFWLTSVICNDDDDDALFI